MFKPVADMTFEEFKVARASRARHSSEVVVDWLQEHPALRVQVLPEALDFGKITVDLQSPVQTVIVTNTGRQPCPILTIRPVGDYVVAHDAPDMLEPGASFQIRAAFRPRFTGSSSGGVYVDTGNAAGTEFAKFIGVGLAKPIDPNDPGSGGNPGTPGDPGAGVDPGVVYDISEIIDAVENSPAFKAVTEKIPEIDANAALIAENSIALHNVENRVEYWGDRTTGVEDAVSVLQTDTSALVQKTNDLLARVQVNEDDIAANYNELTEAIANTNQAIVTSQQQLKAQIAQDMQAGIGDPTQNPSDIENSTRYLVSEVNRTAQALVDQGVAGEAQARAQSEEALYAQIVTDIGTVDGEAIGEHVSQMVAQTVIQTNVVVTALQSSVNQVQNSLAQHGNAIASITESVSGVANENMVTTNWIQTFSSSFNVGPGQTGDQVAATVQNKIDTKATPDEARAIATQSVNAFADGTFAALQESFDSYVDGNEGRWSSTWSIRINAGDPANPVIAGIALSSTPEGSDFVVQADRFAMVLPSTQYGERRYPFIAGVVAGVPTVGINGDLVVDQTITANKIRTQTLSAISVNAGNIAGGTFRTHTLNAAGEIVDPSEFRAEMSNIGTWPLWVGSGAKNAENGVFWIDRAGNAFFGGNVQAGNIRGVFQKTESFNWSGSLEANITRQTPPFTLPAAGDNNQHRPRLEFEVVLDNGPDHSRDGWVDVQARNLSGGDWTTISSRKLTSAASTATSNYIQAFDSATAVAREYRIQVRRGDNSWGAWTLLQVIGFATGIR
ncbi:hydrolase [Stenotrophomonas phage Philippe]|uniref:Tail fiber n=1 Tax=Stenotrophomonas phage Philippe TaxID=2859655 RepID=A0AAE7WMN4_9CAUD|nr:hydrolase [Stenotrophomonas phage Philippe]QYW02286.1 tail fiber [Stenotrophomonas phage Philippe]